MCEKFELGFRGQQQNFLEILISMKGVEMKLKIIKKKCSQFSDTVSHNINPR